jgi:hypothetical protein
MFSFGNSQRDHLCTGLLDRLSVRRKPLDLGFWLEEAVIVILVLS